jgi:hypothetical protein
MKLRNTIESQEGMSNECLEVENYIQSFYFANPDKNFLYQMGVISSLATMRQGYRKLHGIEDQGETHYKMAVNELDFILGYIEKYNFFT